MTPLLTIQASVNLREDSKRQDSLNTLIALVKQIKRFYYLRMSFHWRGKTIASFKNG